MHRIDDISQVCIVGYELLLILFGNHSSKKLTVFRKINSQTNRLFKWRSKYYLPCFFLLFLYNYFIIMFYNIIEILFRLGCSGFCFVFVFFFWDNAFYIFVISWFVEYLYTGIFFLTGDQPYTPPGPLVFLPFV